jgi:hypothetical protein
MNTFFGPLLDVAGYAYASAAVIAPLSGFNVVTGFFEANGKENGST